MTHYTSLEYVASFQMREMERQAELRRLLAEAQRGQRRVSAYRRGAAALGALLVRIGSRLQGAHTPASVSAASAASASHVAPAATGVALAA